MKFHFNNLKAALVGQSLPVPVSGNLSGHAAGEPFDRLVYAELQRQHPKKTYRQFEYLNSLYLKNSSLVSASEKETLFQSPTAFFLLNRGKTATEKWETDNLFTERQNDTADILLVTGNFYHIIDVKTRNVTDSKKSQAPNIISAYKLAQMCAIMLDNQEFDTLRISYIELDWELIEKKPVCTDVHFADLFKENPDNLYINWAAAMQIQFHVSETGQSYTGNQQQWATDYLKHFVQKAKERTSYMHKKFIEPFERYLK